MVSRIQELKDRLRCFLASSAELSKREHETLDQTYVNRFFADGMKKLIREKVEPELRKRRYALDEYIGLNSRPARAKRGKEYLVVGTGISGLNRKRVVGVGPMSKSRRKLTDKQDKATYVVKDGQRYYGVKASSLRSHDKYVKLKEQYEVAERVKKRYEEELDFDLYGGIQRAVRRGGEGQYAHLGKDPQLIADVASEICMSNLFRDFDVWGGKSDPTEHGGTTLAEVGITHHFKQLIRNRTQNAMKKWKGKRTHLDKDVEELSELEESLVRREESGDRLSRGKIDLQHTRVPYVLPSEVSEEQLLDEFAEHMVKYIKRTKAVATWKEMWIANIDVLVKYVLSDTNKELIQRLRREPKNKKYNKLLNPDRAMPVSEFRKRFNEQKDVFIDMLNELNKPLEGITESALDHVHPFEYDKVLSRGKTGDPVGGNVPKHVHMIESMKVEKSKGNAQVPDHTHHLPGQKKRTRKTKAKGNGKATKKTTKSKSKPKNRKKG